jgi:ABC-type branched-subunit amino acid transport system ATPase component
MTKEILNYKRVLQRLTVSQNLHILRAIRENVQSHVVNVSGIYPVFETFGVVKEENIK